MISAPRDRDASLYDSFAQRRQTPPRRSSEQERLVSIVRPASPPGAFRGYRTENSLVSRDATGFTPLREHAAPYVASERSFPNYETPALMDVLIQVQERVISVEKVVERAIPREVPVPKEQIVEQVVERPKIVEKSVVQEKPLIQYVDKKVQLIREVAVERPIERQFVRKVYVERIIEKVVEVIKEVPVEVIVEKTVKIIKKVPVEKVIERIQIKEIPVVQTEERVVEMVKEIPVEIIKEVPVYIKVDPVEWETRHGLKAGVNVYSGVAATSAGGIGMQITLKNGVIVVSELVQGFPAANSGQISINDVLLTVDGTNVEGWPLTNIFSVIQGPANTTVTLGLRTADGRPYTVSLTRMSTQNLVSTGAPPMRITWNKQPSSMRVEYAGMDNRQSSEGRYDPTDQATRAHV